MTRLFLSKRYILPAVAAAAIVHTPAAWAFNISDGNGHVDVLPFQSGSALVTGHYDYDVNQVVEDTRLYVREMDFVFSSLFGTQNPGFTTFIDTNSNAAYTLPASEDLTFNIPTTEGSDSVARNVLFWDGEGTPDFGALSPGDFFRIESNDLDGSGSPIAGFTIDSTAPDGTLHKHVSFSARGDGGVQPADGFYLFAMQLEMNGLSPSEPFYLLFNADYVRDQGVIQFNGERPILNKASEQLATDWVVDNLLTAALPGDLDGDGDVDGVDLSGFFSSFTGPNNGPAPNPLADLDNDGDVDGVDLSGAFSAFTGPLVPATVPEPASLLTLLSGMALMGRRRRAVD